MKNKILPNQQQLCKDGRSVARSVSLLGSSCRCVKKNDENDESDQPLCFCPCPLFPLLLHKTTTPKNKTRPKPLFPVDSSYISL